MEMVTGNAVRNRGKGVIRMRSFILRKHEVSCPCKHAKEGNKVIGLHLWKQGVTAASSLILVV